MEAGKPPFPDTHRRRKDGDRRKHSKSPKKGGLLLDLKPLPKAKTAREPHEPRPEMKRFRKPSDKMKRKKSLVLAWEEEDGSFYNTWNHTNFSVVPKINLKKTVEKENKAKPEKVRKESREKRGQREIRKQNNKTEASSLGNKKKRREIVLAGNKEKETEVLYPTFHSFVKDRQKRMKESGGNAVVIYQREKRRNYLHPQTGDGYRFEKISFAGSCEATVDLVQSKRSLSEPRQKSLNEFYVARRRTRFHLEPKVASTQSDFHSAMDFLQKNQDSIEFKKFDGVPNGFTPQLYDTPFNECEKCAVDKKTIFDSGQKQTVLWKSKSSTDSKAEVVRRLKQTAVKKLDLHREMIRAERVHKKKFWESIERSLNYRCALADMFSSQSFLSQNQSSRFFSTTENSGGRSTGIYVQESVIEKISSYQGFHRLVPPNAPNSQRSPRGMKLNATPSSAYRKMKTVVGSILIKEDEEEEEEVLVTHDLADNFTSRSCSGSTIQPEDTPYETNASFLAETASEKFTLMESSLFGTPKTNSDLEFLMMKLSEEIRKCSLFIKKLKMSTEERERSNLTAEDSSSQEKNIATCRYAVYPFMVYQNAKSPHHGHHTQVTKHQHDNSQSDDVSRQTWKCRKVEPPGSTTSLYSKDPIESPTPKKKCNRRNEFPCCDDCKYLKKRIIKLERELERIEKRMPFYPVEQQDSIKLCLEKLKTTSETVLKRLRSCAKLRYLEHEECRRKKCPTKRPVSAPEPALQKQGSRVVVLRSSNSDCQLKVGMEITMENMDPVTGEKLHPEVKSNTEQEGNIQCKLYRDGKEPLLVMDTDFAYNPNTGMLFKKNEASQSRSHTTDVVIPINKTLKKTPSAMELTTEPPKKEEKSLETFQFTMERQEPFEEKKEPEEMIQCRSKTTLPPGKSSSGDLKNRRSKVSTAEEQATRSRSKESEEGGKKEKSGDEKKSKGRRRECLGGKFASRIPTRRKTTPSPSNSQAESLSQKSSISASSYVDRCGSPSASSSKNSVKLAKLFSFTWTFGFFLCKLVHYMQSVSAICSVLTLTAMSLERYYAIVHPMKAQYICTISQARRIITGTWVSAFLLAVPILFAQVHLRVGVKVEAYWCVRDWDNKTIWRAHELYMMLLILVVPTGVMAVAYTAICWEIWEVIQRRQDMTSGKGHGTCRKLRFPRPASDDSFPSALCSNNSTKLDKRRGRPFKKDPGDDGASVKQVIKMLVAVVVIYVLCWGPMLIDNVLQAYGILSHIRMGWLKYMGTAFHLMAYFNSCINPIIYGFMSKNFRESFRKTLCCGGKKPKTALRSFSLSQTRNTSIRYAESSFGRTVSIALPV